MPDTTIAPFDPDALKKRVSETIQASFGALIPESTWQAMVDKEVKAFFEEPGAEWIVEKRGDGRWNSTDTITTLQSKMTPFRRMVWEKVQELCKAKIESLLNGDTLRGYVDNYSGPDGRTTKVELSDYLEKKLVEIAPAMAVTFFRGAFGAAVEQAKQEIRTEISQRR